MSDTLFVELPIDRLINELFVWLAEDPKTKLEGIVSITMMGDTMMAASFSLQAAIKLRPQIQEVARVTGKRIRLVRFLRGTVIDTVQGGSDGERYRE